MGYRNDNLLDEAADARVRDLLANSGATGAVTPPIDLVQRVRMRLPAATPQHVLQHRRRQARRRLIAGGSLAAVWVLLAIFGFQLMLGAPGEQVATVLARTAGTLAPDPTMVQTLSPALRIGGGLALAAILAAAVLICLRIWPYRTTASALTLIQAPLRVVLPGLLAVLVLIPISVVLSAFLAITLAGLPLSVLICFGDALLFVYALATLARAFALSLGEPIDPAGPHTAAVLIGAGLALPIGLLAAFSPLTALLLSSLLAIPGLGAIIYSRGGTRMESFEEAGIHTGVS
jgi:hypothetical protein